MCCFPHYLRDNFLLKENLNVCNLYKHTVYTVFEKNSIDYIVRIQQNETRIVSG